MYISGLVLEHPADTALRHVDMILQAGIPAGVVNIVTGEGPEAGAARGNIQDPLAQSALTPNACQVSGREAGHDAE
jgi:hypothetical protein